MLSRRPHKKSRLGCKNCKLRRIKCDEVHPVCGTCHKLKIHCNFIPRDSSNLRLLDPIILPAQNNTTRAASEPTLPSTSQVIKVAHPGLPNPFSNLEDNRNFAEDWPLPSPVCTPPDRLLDLKFFHHWVQMTSSIEIMDSVPSEYAAPVNHEDIWARWITPLAFQSPSLMDGLLGFSAFHLHCINPSDRGALQMSQKYMLRAISAHAEDLRRGINSKNAETVFAASTFIAFHSSFSQRFQTDRKGPPLHWFRAYQGVRAVLRVAWPWLEGTDIRRFIERELDFLKPMEETLRKATDLPFDFLLNDLDLENKDEETFQCYKDSVALLNWVQLSRIYGRVRRFPAMLPDRFVSLLAAEDPRTLTIVGYFLMLLRRVGAIWWLKGVVKDEFEMLMDLLPKAWWSQMDWAIQEFKVSDMEGEVKDSESQRVARKIHVYHLGASLVDSAWIERKELRSKA